MSAVSESDFVTAKELEQALNRCWSSGDGMPVVHIEGKTDYRVATSVSKAVQLAMRSKVGGGYTLPRMPSSTEWASLFKVIGEKRLLPRGCIEPSVGLICGHFGIPAASIVEAAGSTFDGLVLSYVYLIRLLFPKNALVESFGTHHREAFMTYVRDNVAPVAGRELPTYSSFLRGAITRFGTNAGTDASSVASNETPPEATVELHEHRQQISREGSFHSFGENAEEDSEGDSEAESESHDNAGSPDDLARRFQNIVEQRPEGRRQSGNVSPPPAPPDAERAARAAAAKANADRAAAKADADRAAAVEAEAARVAAAAAQRNADRGTSTSQRMVPPPPMVLMQDPQLLAQNEALAKELRQKTAQIDRMEQSLAKLANEKRYRDATTKEMEDTIRQLTIQSTAVPTATREEVRDPVPELQPTRISIGDLVVQSSKAKSLGPAEPPQGYDYSRGDYDRRLEDYVDRQITTLSRCSKTAFLKFLFYNKVTWDTFYIVEEGMRKHNYHWGLEYVDMNTVRDFLSQGGLARLNDGVGIDYRDPRSYLSRIPELESQTDTDFFLDKVLGAAKVLPNERRPAEQPFEVVDAVRRFRLLVQEHKGRPLSREARVQLNESGLLLCELGAVRSLPLREAQAIRAAFRAELDLGCKARKSSLQLALDAAAKGREAYFSKDPPKPKPKGKSGGQADTSSVKCFNCQKLGHYANQCKAPKASQPASRTNRTSKNGDAGAELEIEIVE